MFYAEILYPWNRPFMKMFISVNPAVNKQKSKYQALTTGVPNID